MMNLTMAAILEIEDEEEEVERGEDHINGIPDELIVLIFDKLSEAKCLFICSMVSKRFASLVLQTHTVSIEIPNKPPFLKKNTTPQHPKNKLLHFLTKPLRFLHKRLPSPKPSFEHFVDNGSLIQTFQFLKNFSSIQSLCVQVLPSASCRDPGDDLLIKWKVEFMAGVPVFVILLAKSLSAAKTHGEEDDSIEPELTGDGIGLRVLMAHYHLMVARLRRKDLCRLMVDNNLMIRNVVITDSKKQGRFSVRKEQVVEFMNPKQPPPPPEENGYKPTSVFFSGSYKPNWLRLWYVPVLRLPSSGCVMKEVSLAISKVVEWTKEINNGDDDDAFLIGGDDVFEGEGEEKAAFDEAMVEMLKKNPVFTSLL